MKTLTVSPLRFIPAALCLVCALLAYNARAAINLYWDPNGTTAGYGGNGSWDGANWATASGGGQAVGNWQAGAFARFLTTTNFTVTVNASESMAGLFNTVAAATVTINDAGSGTGNLNISTTGGTVTANDPTINVQGFLCSGTVIVNCPIIGSGGIQHSQAKDLYLNATNSYAGGTWTTGGQLIYYNNEYAFGTGTIYVGGSADAIINSSGRALIITNKFLFPTANYTFNLAGGNPVGGKPGTSFTGPWFLPAGTTTLYTSSGASQVVAISNVISGAGATLNTADNGTLILAGTNTYTGATGVGGYVLTATTPSLEIAGAIAGDLVVHTGAKSVKLDHAATLKPTAKLYLTNSVAAGTVNLNYTGTNTILAIYIDGALQAAGTWGAPGSGAMNESAFFSGAGMIGVAAAPTVVTQPAPVGVYPTTPSATMSVAVTGDQPSYQWKRNGSNLTDADNVGGWQTATLTLYPPYTAGTYTCAITNVAGYAISQPATLTILPTSDYVNAVLTAGPLAYWRLDETSGNVALDGVGFYNGTYINANMNQPGFSVVPGSDAAMGLPRDAAQKGYMVISNAAPFSFPAMPFTLEAWAMSTNFAAGVKQRIVSTLTKTGAGGYGFGFPDDHTLQLTAGGVGEFNGTISPPLASGMWYHFVVTCDGNSYTLYLNGNSISNRAVSGMALPASPGQLCVGNNPLDYPSEQLYGKVDEVAIYNYALDESTILAHYRARYTDAPLTVTTPLANPSTNYVSLSATITEDASGAELTYQWYRGAGTGTPVGGNSSALTLSPLQLSDSGDYHVVVTDAGNHTQDSPTVHLQVLPIPSDPAQLNLTNGLVVHLGFDGDCADISGRANHGTPMQNGAAATANFVSPGAVGASALHYSTAADATNYVTLGVQPDLQFGTSTDFTVAYWVRGTGNTKLPVLCNAANGAAGIVALGGGFFFGPNKTANGGWEVALGGTAHEMDAPGNDIINDGNWHHMVFAGKRAGNITVYLDGVQVGTHAMSYVTDSIDVANPANIGQDGTGAMAVPDQGGEVDDLAVWRRVLTPFEVSGIFLAAATNGVTFAPPVAAPPTPTTITSFVGATLSYTGGGGSQFVLLGSPDLTAPVSSWSRMATNGASPGSFTLPTTGSPAAMFYRIKSE